jgi:predicted esterase
MRTFAALTAAVAAVALGACSGGSHATFAESDETNASVSPADVAKRDPAAYRYALAHGARVEQDPWSGSFTVHSATPAKPSALVVAVHGHNGNAFHEYRLWEPYAAAHGLGLVSIEWQTRWGRETAFLDAQTTYETIRRAVAQEGTQPGRVLLHGFSQGSHEAFELTSIDRREQRLFAMTLAESGGAHEGSAADPSLAGSHWAVYCAGRDQWPDVSGCPAMRQAVAFLTGSGAFVDRFIVDPQARHGGFLRNPRDVDLVLGDFAKMLAH